MDEWIARLPVQANQMREGLGGAMEPVCPPYGYKAIRLGRSN